MGELGSASSEAEYVNRAKWIYKNYITDEAPLQINIPSDQRKKLDALFEQSKIARNEIEVPLQAATITITRIIHHDVYRRIAKTSAYKSLGQV